MEGKTGHSIIAAGSYLLAGALALLGGVRAANADSGPPVQITFSTAFRADSNAARSSSVLAARRGLTKSDQRISPQVAVTVNRSSGITALNLDALIGYDFYNHNHRLNRERISVDGSALARPGPCEVQFSPSYKRQQSDLADLSLINEDGVVGVRNVEQIQDYLGQVTCSRPSGFGLTANVGRNIQDNSNALRRISDNRATRWGGGVTYRNPVIGNFSLTGQRVDVTYPRRAGTNLAAIDSYRMDSVRLSADRQIGSRLQASGSIAHEWLRAGSSAPTFTGFSYNLALTAELLPQLQVSAAIDESTNPSLTGLSLYQRSRTRSINATYALTQRTRLNLGASERKSRYHGVVASILPEFTSNRVREVHGGMDFTPGGRLSFGLDAGHESRRSNISLQNYKNTYGMLRAKLAL